MYVSALGKPIVIVGSIEAARDLLDKKGNNMSDRPRLPLYEM